MVQALGMDSGRNSGITLAEWLDKGEFGLAMSSGFFGFFAHAGMVKALYEHGFRPSRLHGSSAGALVAGMLAAGLDPGQVRDVLISVKREDFWDPGLGLGLLKGTAFRRLLEDVLGRGDLQDAQMPIKVSAHDLLSFDTVVLEQGSLAEAVHASCAFPLLFQPVRVNDRLLADGGISDRPGTKGVESGARLLLHHLPSRSPWRLKTPLPPRLPNSVCLAIHGLPRSGPFKLDRGKKALDLAYHATIQALDSALQDYNDLYLVAASRDIHPVACFTG